MTIWLNGRINELKIVINKNADAQTALYLVKPLIRSALGGSDDNRAFSFSPIEINISLTRLGNGVEGIVRKRIGIEFIRTARK